MALHPDSRMGFAIDCGSTLACDGVDHRNTCLVKSICEGFRIASDRQVDPVAAQDLLLALRPTGDDLIDPWEDNSLSFREPLETFLEAYDISLNVYTYASSSADANSAFMFAVLRSRYPVQRQYTVNIVHHRNHYMVFMKLSAREVHAYDEAMALDMQTQEIGAMTSSVCQDVLHANLPLPQVSH